ncbi:hypothetical protein Ddc_00806 [Ditylenchus destructor]|nr:hypothetical protein Ddc_00806 [Ditylenchus destructor]
MGLTSFQIAVEMYSAPFRVIDTSHIFAACMYYLLLFVKTHSYSSSSCHLLFSERGEAESTNVRGKRNNKGGMDGVGARRGNSPRRWFPYSALNRWESQRKYYRSDGPPAAALILRPLQYIRSAANAISLLLRLLGTVGKALIWWQWGVPH